MGRNGGWAGSRSHRADVHRLRHAMLAVPCHLRVAAGADGDALRQHRELLGRRGGTRHRPHHQRSRGGGTRHGKHRRSRGTGARHGKHRRSLGGGTRHRSQHSRSRRGGTRHGQHRRRQEGGTHHGQDRRSRHDLHLPGVEAAELLGQCDGGALVAAQHDEAAGEAAVGDAEVGVLGAEFVRLARGVGELGDAEVVAVGGVLVLPREAGRLGLRTTASGEEERIAGVGMKRTARRVVRATARRRRWPDLAGLMGRRRRRPEARE